MSLETLVADRRTVLRAGVVAGVGLAGAAVLATGPAASAATVPALVKAPPKTVKKAAAKKVVTAKKVTKKVAKKKVVKKKVVARKPAPKPAPKPTPKPVATTPAPVVPTVPAPALPTVPVPTVPVPTVPVPTTPAPTTPAPSSPAPVSTAPSDPAVPAPSTPAAPPVPWPAVMPPAVSAVVPGGVPLSTDPVMHLLRRATWGVTPALRDEVTSLGVGAWLDQQLDPASIDDSACTAALVRFPYLQLTSLATHRLMADFSWDAMHQTQTASMMRQVASRRQLFEVMVEFWNQHLNVTCPSDAVWLNRHVHDRTVIRRYALGKVSDLLAATIQSPAMLRYLNNDESRGDDPNENLGRELLELHTVSPAAGYTETEMRHAALAITGFSVMDDGSETFLYKPGWRWTGPLQVLGWSSPNDDPANGVAVGLSLVDYLAHHPQTAQHIARKLAVRFVSDTPSQGLVDTLAAAYLANDTAVVPVLRTLFGHPEFWSSVGAKVRRPQEHLVAVMRLMGATPSADTNTEGWDSTIWIAHTLGQAPLAWPTPDGYHDVASSWVSSGTTLGQWNASNGVIGRWFVNNETVTDSGVDQPASTWQVLIGATRPATAGEFVDRLTQRVLGQTIPAAWRSTLLGAINTGKTATSTLQDWELDNYTQLIVLILLASPIWSLR